MILGIVEIFIISSTWMSGVIGSDGDSSSEMEVNMYYLNLSGEDLGDINVDSVLESERTASRLEVHKTTNILGNQEKLERLIVGMSDLETIWINEECLKCFEEFSPQGKDRLKIIKDIALIPSSVTDIPSELGMFKNLYMLSIYYDGDDEFSLKNMDKRLSSDLVEFRAPRCKIKNIPEEIGNMKKLQFLYLPDNQIKKIPDVIGEMEKLRSADFKNNLIEGISISLLHKFRAHRSPFCVELSGNAGISKYSRGNSPGYITMKKILQKKLKFKVPESYSGEMMEKMEISGVKDVVAQQPLVWNMEKMRLSRLRPWHWTDVGCRVSIREMNDLISSLFHNSSEGCMIRYSIDRVLFIDKKVSGEILEFAKDIVDEIFIDMESCMGRNQADRVKLCLDDIGEILNLDQDMQMIVLGMIHVELGRTESSMYENVAETNVIDIEEFVESVIVSAKNYALEMAIQPLDDGLIDEDTRRKISMYWRGQREFFEYTGIPEPTEFCVRPEEDMYGENIGNLLMEFHHQFLPEDFASTLSWMIRKYKKVKKAREFLSSCISRDLLKQCFIMDDADGREYPSYITIKGL